MYYVRYKSKQRTPRDKQPEGISYSDGFYYLMAWNDEYDAMTELRIEK